MAKGPPGKFSRFDVAVAIVLAATFAAWMFGLRASSHHVRRIRWGLNFKLTHDPIGWWRRTWPPLIYGRWQFPRHPREARGRPTILLWRSTAALTITNVMLAPVIKQESRSGPCASMQSWCARLHWKAQAPALAAYPARPEVAHVRS